MHQSKFNRYSMDIKRKERPRIIKLIKFKHDGIEWTAQVGEKLRGVQYKTVHNRKNGNYSERIKHFEDSARVVKIVKMKQDIYYVYTDAYPNNEIVSGWLNPFMIGRNSIFYDDLD